MISKQDVEKLAGLARLGLTDAEKDKFPGEIDSILGYVGKVMQAAEAAPSLTYVSTNTLREDAVVHERGAYTAKLLASAPISEGGYVKVKKILE